MEFRLFLEGKEEEKDIKETLKRLPKKISSLIKGYEFKFQKGNVLTGDNDHVGIINPSKKTITLAGAWRHSREFIFLHELAHMVWEYIISPEQKKEWKILFKKSKIKLKEQGEEEIFCHVFSNHFCKYKNEAFLDKKLENFIIKICERN